MPTSIFKVVCHHKKNNIVEFISIVYRGNYDNCLKFYMENKAKYREENKFLELKIG